LTREERFLALYRPEQSRLYRTAWAILGNEPDAADALQETAIRAYRSLDQLRGGEQAFPAWIRRILVNTCSQMLRRRGRQIPVERPEDFGPEPTQPDLELPFDGDVWEAVQQLDERYRPVVVLRFLNDMQLDEIARALQIPLGTVKSRLHAAMLQLRRLLERAAERRGAV
jgi:RNA polymerase sigma-70 factor, ECF subfamily